MFAILGLSTLLYASNPVINVNGTINGNLDVSAISCMSKTCILASDETNSLQTFTLNNGEMKVSPKKVSLGKYKKENDLEGLTNDGENFYAVGSHGISRIKGKYQKARYRLFKVKLNEQGELSRLIILPLKQILKKHHILKYFYKVRLQENGINIEGLAYNNGKLYVGFRTPIIKGKAQILEIDANNFTLENSKLISVDLGGLGIRSIEFSGDQLYAAAGAAKPDDIQIAKFAKIDLKNHHVSMSSVPFDNLKLEGFEIVNNNALLIYDSEENGMPTVMNLR